MPSVACSANVRTRTHARGVSCCLPPRHHPQSSSIPVYPQPTCLSVAWLVAPPAWSDAWSCLPTYLGIYAARPPAHAVRLPAKTSFGRGGGGGRTHGEWASVRAGDDGDDDDNGVSRARARVTPTTTITHKRLKTCKVVRCVKAAARRRHGQALRPHAAQGAAGRLSGSAGSWVLAAAG